MIAGREMHVNDSAMLAKKSKSHQSARRAICLFIGAIPATVVAAYASSLAWSYANDGTSKVFTAVGFILAVGAIWGTVTLSPKSGP